MNIATFLGLTLASVCQADSDRSPQESPVKAWIELCSSRATDYEIFPTGKPQEEFKLLPKPVFHHSQPVRQGDIGAVYVWVRADGRPAVIGALFACSPSLRDGSRSVLHEMHSLADVPLTARWQRRGDSVEVVLPWKPIPDAPVAGDTRSKRLRQARSLSRQFRGHSIDPKGGRWELRLISRPLYDYDAEGSDSILGGALFAFCQGTDTEIVLVLEARRTEEGYRWHFACADLSDYGLYLRLGDAEIWSSPRNFFSGLKWTSKFYRVQLPENLRKTLQSSQPRGGRS